MSFKNTLENWFFQPKEDGSLEQQPSSQTVNQSSTADPAVATPMSGDVQQYVAGFREAVKQREGISVKYIEFLYKTAENPKPEDFKKAFDFLRIMFPNATVDEVLADLQLSQNLITSETQNYLNQGNNAKSRLEQTREKERTQLEANITGFKNEIAELETQLREKNAALSNEQSILAKLNAKFQPELDKIDRTIQDVSRASEIVGGSLTQVRSGIQANLK
jgi:hypothetical protein